MLLDIGDKLQEYSAEPKRWRYDRQRKKCQFSIRILICSAIGYKRAYKPFAVRAHEN